MNEHEPDHKVIASVNPIPAVILCLFLVMVVVEAAFSLGAAGYIGGPEAIGWRLSFVNRFAFSGVIFDWMLENNRWPFDQIIRTVTYPFVHSSFTHAAISSVMMLALGKKVAEEYGSISAVILFFIPAILGAVAFALFTSSAVPLLGAFPVIFGFVGAYTYYLWVRLGSTDQPQLRAFGLIGMLLLMRLIFGVLYGSQPDWVADVTAFVAGLALSPLLAPGGWRRFIGLIRRD